MAKKSKITTKNARASQGGFMIDLVRVLRNFQPLVQDFLASTGITPVIPAATRRTARRRLASSAA